MRKYIFDVDGTLTESRKPIHSGFKQELNKFLDIHDCFVVTGSDREKTVEQLGYDTYRKFKMCFQCCGNDVWIKDDNVYTRETTLPDDMKEMLNTFLDESMFSRRTGNHIEIRPGLINFSVLGRGASEDERKMYIKWDKETNERELLSAMLKDVYSDKWEFHVAGDTGIDIVEKNCGKEQILQKYFTYEDEIMYFGDKMDPGGNDYEISRAVIARNDISIRVSDWTQTWHYIKTQE